MGFELHKVVHDWVDRYELRWDTANLRRTDRDICRAHPEWIMLTDEELARVDARDRWGYTIMKNVAPEGFPLEYYVTKPYYLLRLLPTLNPQNHTSAGGPAVSLFEDKNYHEVFMPELRFPQAVIRRINGVFYGAGYEIISREEAEKRVGAHESLVFKKTVNTAHGEGVRKVAQEEYHKALDDAGSDYIVQELVRQHAVLARFNPSSVNILRLTTLFWRGDVYLLGGVLRVGAPGAFCDHENKGGYNFLTIPLADDGTILPRPVDMDDYRAYHDCRGIPVTGTVPDYEGIKTLALRAHSRYPHFRLIGWDIAVDEAGGPVFMEFNTRYPGMNGTQLALGAVFAQKSVRGVPLLDEIHEECPVKPDRKDL